jgi:hypothetical protein
MLNESIQISPSPRIHAMSLKLIIDSQTPGSFAS